MHTWTINDIVRAIPKCRYSDATETSFWCEMVKGFGAIVPLVRISSYRTQDGPLRVQYQTR